MQKKALTDIAIHLARGNLLGLVSNLASNAINKFKKKLWKEEKDWLYLFQMKIWMIL